MSDFFALSARRIFDGEAWHEGAALIVRGDAVESIVASAKIPAGAEIVEAFARHRGLNPDQPPNLRKVTETI